MDVPIYRLDHYSLPQPQSLPAATVELEITRGRVQHRVRPVRSKVFLIGAANDCDLVLGDLQFPEAYAYVFVNASDVSIRRLGTGPDLRVCGEIVEAAELFQGDLIAFGPFELRVRIEEPANSRTGGRSDSARRRTSDSGDDADDPTLEVRLLLADIHRALAEGSFPLPGDEEAISHLPTVSPHRACA